MPNKKIKVLLTGSGPSYINNEIFDKNSRYNRDNYYAPYIYLKQFLKNKNVEINTINLGDIDAADVIIFFDYSTSDTYFKLCSKKKMFNKMILFLFEPPAVRPSCYNKKHLKYFKRIYTWRDDLVDNKRYFKFFWPQNVNYAKYNLSFKNKKFITLMNANKYSFVKGELYSKRVNAIKYFEKNNIDFDLYGFGWNKSNFTLVILYHVFRHFFNLNLNSLSCAFTSLFGYPKFSCYCGTMDNKFKVLSKYKFAICFENQGNLPGYFTEKIFDCFNAKCVPIYYGATNVTKYIPENCFIDFRKFKNYEQLFNFITTISECEYEQYILNIEKYIKKLRTNEFSIQNFAKTVHSAIFKIDLHQE